MAMNQISISEDMMTPTNDPGESGRDSLVSGSLTQSINWPQGAGTHVKTARKGTTIHREADVLQKCAHENVVTYLGSRSNTELLLEIGEHDLWEHVATTEEKCLPIDEVLEIAQGIARGLKHIHQEGYAHNDLKLENVVMCKVARRVKLVPKIIDFEFATYRTDFMKEITGTKAYFSPERFVDVSEVRDWSQHGGSLADMRREFDHQAADMWALGVAIHLCTYGSFPTKSLEGLPTLIRDYRADAELGEVLGPVLEGLLKVNVQDRWTAGDLMRHLAVHVTTPEVPSLVSSASSVVGREDRLYSPLALEKEIMMSLS